MFIRNSYFVSKYFVNAAIKLLFPTKCCNIRIIDAPLIYLPELIKSFKAFVVSSLESTYKEKCNISIMNDCLKDISGSTLTFFD